uniref:Uncharacterized protein n=1 Tax=Panagrolaimus davidi TaxID=227884 RepID=A0A914QUL5_9BILA
MATTNKNYISSHKTYMYLINFLLISILSFSLFPTSVNGQDFYGASYANNRSPDEIRQRARNNNGFDEPSAAALDDGIGGGGGAGNEIGSEGGGNNPRQGCPGPWQWQCDSGHCIAQYDLCDGVTQCPDESDEKNCRGRFVVYFF